MLTFRIIYLNLNQILPPLAFCQHDEKNNFNEFSELSNFYVKLIVTELGRVAGVMYNFNFSTFVIVEPHSTGRASVHFNGYIDRDYSKDKSVLKRRIYPGMLIHLEYLS